MKNLKLNLTTASILIIFIAIINSWIAVDRIKEKSKEKTSEYLHAILETANQNYHSWFDSHISNVYTWVPLIKPYVEELLKLHPYQEGPGILTLKTEIYNLLKSLYSMYDYEDFFIVGKENINLVSLNDRDTGKMNLLAGEGDFLKRVWSGEILISSPMYSDVPLPEKNDNLQERRVMMFLGAPVKNETGSIIAVLILCINPDKEFTQIFQRGRISSSGETYGVSRNGIMLTNSRFQNQLGKIGLLQPGESEILNLKVSDPGVNLLKNKKRKTVGEPPLTHMAQSIAAGKSGSDMEGYRDYRGVKVVGVWKWNDRVGFGIATEIDCMEAYNDFYSTRTTIIILTILGIGIVLCLLFLFHWLYGKVMKNEKALKEAQIIGKSGYWDFNFITGKSVCSENYYRLFGYDPFGFQPSFNNFKNRVFPDDLQIIEEGLQKIQKEKREMSFELRMVKKDGTLAWHNFRVIPEFDQEILIKLRGTAQDITESKNAEELLMKKYKLEKIIADTSSKFIHLPLNKIHKAIKDALPQISKFTNADRSYVFQFTEDGTTMENTHEWCAKGIEPLIHNFKEIPVNSFPWWMEKLNQHEVIQINNTDGLPNEATSEKEIIQARNIQSLLVIPMIQNKRLYGFIGLDSVLSKRIWDEQEIVLLKITAEIFSNAIARKIAKQTLLKTNTLLERMFASTEFMLAYLDPSFNFIRVNNAYAEKDGFSPDFYEGKNHFKLYPHEENEKIFRRVLKTGEVFSIKAKPFVNPLHPERGTTYWDWTLNPIKDKSGLVSGLIYSLNDVTERKRAEEKIHKLNAELELKVQVRTKDLENTNTRLQEEVNEREKAEKRISLILESNPYAIILVDSEGIIKMASLTSEKYFGYKKEELIGINIHNLVPAENRTNHYSVVGNFLKKPESRAMGKGRDLYALRKDGTIFPVEIGLTPIEFDGERMIMTNIIDITERKKAEELILQAKSEAEEANRAKSRFLANMSHEIRTPMNAIIGFSDMLYSSLKEEKQRSQIETIRSSGRNLLRIINDILDLSKIEAGKMVIQKQVVDINKLAKEMERIFSHKTSEKDISFFIKAESKISTLMLDEIRLRQILFNLLGNAVKFTEKGHIILTLDIKEKSGNVNDLILKIEDTGIGIPKKDQKLIFEAFSQQDELTGGKYGGTGLGLSITRRLVEMMDGEISVSSEPDKGSIFTVYLPNVETVHMETGNEEESVFAPSSVIFEKAKVLVVDDNKANRDLITSLLKYSPLILFEAINGKEAVESATQNLPDLILMDLRMPEMNGLEATKLLRKQEKTKSIPVVAISASHKIIMGENKMSDIFNDYLLKPIELEELTETLKRYLKYKVVEPQKSSGSGEPPGIRLEINEEQKKNLQDLIIILENEFIPFYGEVIKNQMIDQIEQFGKNLTALAEKESFEFILQYGHEICILADNFEIEKLLKILKKFPDIVEELKSQILN